MPVLAGPSGPPAGNYILNVSTTASQPAFNVASGTVSGTLIVGQCMTTLGGSCGAGGGSTATVNLASQYSDAYYSAPGSSNVVSGLSPGTTWWSLLSGGPNAPPVWFPVVLSTGALQSGATFYVSSGTLAVQLNIGTGSNAYAIYPGSLQLKIQSPSTYGISFYSLNTESFYVSTAIARVDEPIQMVEGVAPSGTSGSDFLWGDSTYHWPRFEANNGTANYLVTGSSTSNTAGHLATWSSNGLTLLDGGTISGNFIQLTSALQTGATFYVSSGTVAGPLTANSFDVTSTSGSISGVSGSIGLTNSLGDVYLNPKSGNNVYVTQGGNLAFLTSGGYEGFYPASSLSSNLLWQLPSLDGAANQCLSTDGSKHLGWTTTGGGSTVLQSSGVAFGSASNTVAVDTNNFTWNGPLSNGLYASTGTISSMTVTSINIAGVGSLSKTALTSLSLQSTLSNGNLYLQTQSGQSIIVPNGNKLMFNASSGGNSGFTGYTGAAVGPVWHLPGSDSSGCFQSDGSGNMSIASCGTGGGGGSSSLAVTTGAVTGFSGTTSSPTAVIVADSRVFNGQLTANSTYFWTINPASVTAQGYITAASLGAITGNQSITWTGSGDVSGTASGATSISPTLTAAASQPNIFTLGASSVTINNYAIYRGSVNVLGAGGIIDKYGISASTVNISSNTILAGATIYYQGYILTPSTVNAGAYQGGGLSTCGSSSQALSWSSTEGQYGCTTITAAGIGALTGNQTITLTGPVTGSGATSIADSLSLNPSASITGTLSASNMVSTAAFTTSTQTWTANQTFQNAIYISTSIIANGAVGSSGQVLSSQGPGLPVQWATASGTGGGIVSPGTFTWTDNYGITGSTLVFSTGTFTYVSGSTISYSSATFSNATVYGGAISVATLATTGANGLNVTNGGNISGGTLSVNQTNGVDFLDASTSHGVVIKAPSSVTTYNLLLPGSQGGVSTLLQNDGSGNLSWASSSGALLASTQTFTGANTFQSSTTYQSTVTYQNISSTTYTNVSTMSATNLYFDITGSSVASAAGILTNSCGYIIGTMVQEISSTSVNAQMISGAAFTNATAWNTTITPKCATDQIRVTWTGGVITQANALFYFTLLRDSTDLSQGTNGLSFADFNTASNIETPLTMIAYDSPGDKSSHTYGLSAKGASGNVQICDANSNQMACRMFVEEYAK